jgi:hypothetical protein
MGTADQYRARADFCQRMAEKATGEKARATWLNLAANALASAEKPTQTHSKSFYPRERFGGRRQVIFGNITRSAACHRMTGCATFQTARHELTPDDTPPFLKPGIH